MAADVLDIFAAAASPAWRTSRPAQVRARMAWARQRLATARVAPPAEVQGVRIGDWVRVEYRPGALTDPGVVVAWERSPTATVALVRAPDILTAGRWMTLRAPRHRLNPTQPPESDHGQR
jgi:hypothetical protein